MKISAEISGGTIIRTVGRYLCRRMLAGSVLVTCVFVVPVIASVSRMPLHEVRLPRIDSRVVENLQRWAGDEKDSWSEEI
jgi:hypothetical protein